jgi:hypothetical protein
MGESILEKLGRVLREQFADYELDRLFEISSGTLLDILEKMPPEEASDEED